MGVIRFPFYNLEKGEHSITLKVWDVFNNSSESTINFVVKDVNDLIKQREEERDKLMNMNINDLKRPIMTLREEYVYSFRKLRSALFNKFPNRLRSLLRG